MRKIKETSNVEISGMFENASFGIVESEHTYELLTGKQYTNPLTSTLRALIENALDAQTQAKVDRPIDIEFQKNMLIITDYGNGISPEVMQNYYTKYFASNRTASDDFYGGFGVGSKAIFSVVPSVTLQTKHDGTLYEWKLSKEKNAKPTAELVHREKTSEQGTRIHIDLDQNLANRSYSPLKFDIYTMLLELDHLSPKTINIITNETKNASPRPYERTSHMLRIGLMPYPVPPAEVLKLPEHMYKETYMPTQTLNRKKFGVKKAAPYQIALQYITLDLDIKDIEPHYSKERIAYTPKNIECVREKFKDVWLTHQWNTALYLSTSVNADSPKYWRLHSSDAQELLVKGHDPKVLAWASRPDCVHGHISKLQNNEVRLYPNGVEENSKNWGLHNTNDKSWGEVKAWAATWGIKVRTSDEQYICTVLANAEKYDDRQQHNEFWEKFTHTTEDLPKNPFVLIDVTSPLWTSLHLYERKLIINDLKELQPVLTNVPDKIIGHTPHAIPLDQAWRDYWSSKGAEDVLGNIKIIVQDQQSTHEKDAWIKVLSQHTVVSRPHHDYHCLINIQKHLKNNITFVSVAELKSQLTQKHPLLNFIDTNSIDSTTISHIQDITSL